MADFVRRMPPAELGLILCAARARAGLSLRETARRARITHQYLWNLERSRRSPSAVVASALADSLDLLPDERAVLDRAAVTDAGRSHPLKRPPGAVPMDAGEDQIRT